MFLRATAGLLRRLLTFRQGAGRPQRSLMALVLMVLLLTSCAGGDISHLLGPVASSTPTPTDTPAPTVTPSWTPTRASTPTRIPTAAATPKPALTSTIALTPPVTATLVSTATATVVPVRLDKTENILILGTDQRPGDTAWRTDTIMVAVIDYDLGQVAVISIPRDLLVEIPGYGPARINQADYLGEMRKYPGGGAKLVGKILDDVLGIPTQRYVRLTYDGLPRVVDALGGVTVHLDCPLFEQTPDPNDPERTIDWSLPAGDVFLDGQTAKKFATYRYLTTDFGRARRQQQLIWAIRSRALQLDIIPKIPELWRALSDVFVTDLTLLDAIRLARLGANLGPEKVRGVVLGPEILTDQVTPEGAWVLVMKDRAGLEAVKANLFKSPPLAELEHNATSNGGCKPPPPGYTAPQPMPTPVKKAP